MPWPPLVQLTLSMILNATLPSGNRKIKYPLFKKKCGGHNFAHEAEACLFWSWLVHVDRCGYDGDVFTSETDNIS